MSNDRIGLDLGNGGQADARFHRRPHPARVPQSPAGPLLDAGRLPEGFAFTTDSYVVDPPVFPGGDIGTLAVNGTVNDLVVSGANPSTSRSG